MRVYALVCACMRLIRKKEAENERDKKWEELEAMREEQALCYRCAEFRVAEITA